MPEAGAGKWTGCKDRQDSPTKPPALNPIPRTALSPGHTQNPCPAFAKVVEQSTAPHPVHPIITG